jgi:hypothetical protein
MRTTMLFSVLLTALTCTPASGVIYSQIPGVYSTGVDDGGVPLAAGTLDSHYTLASSPTGAGSVKVTAPYFMWAPGTASSAWINQDGSATAGVEGYYTYTMTFSLSGFDHTTASIGGNWATDNTSTILLNGNPTGITHSTPWEFVTFEAFVISSGFVPGLNTLSFVVYNVPTTDVINPTGLQVNITSALAVVPEPSSVALFALAGVMALIRRGRPGAV